MGAILRYHETANDVVGGRPVWVRARFLRELSDEA